MRQDWLLLHKEFLVYSVPWLFSPHFWSEVLQQIRQFHDFFGWYSDQLMILILKLAMQAGIIIELWL